MRAQEPTTFHVRNCNEGRDSFTVIRARDAQGAAELWLRERGYGPRPIADEAPGGGRIVVEPQTPDGARETRYEPREHRITGEPIQRPDPWAGMRDRPGRYDAA